jgi:hypothetical protein
VTSQPHTVRESGRRRSRGQPATGAEITQLASRCRLMLDELAVFGGNDDVRNGFEVWDELADVIAVGIGLGIVGGISALIEATAPTRPTSLPRPRISCANAAVSLHNTSRPSS